MVAVNYLWNPISDNIVREFDDGGTTIVEYTTEPELYGNVVSQYRDGETSYLHSDGLGSTTEVTNDAGNVTDTIRYSAFGEVTHRTGTTEIPFQYVGQKGYYTDELAGESSVRQRRQIPADGRWSSLDAIFLGVGDSNPYIYVSNCPLSRIDPSGRLAEPAPRPPPPRTPPRPRLSRIKSGCTMTIGNFVILQEFAPGTDIWSVLVNLNASISGFAPGDCRKKTYNVDLVLFETVRQGEFALGPPPVPRADISRPEGIANAHLTLLRGECIQGPSQVKEDRVAGVFVTVPFECYSPCSRTCKCQKDLGEVVLSCGLKSVPAVWVRWTFAPEDHNDDCTYLDCDVELTVSQ